MKLSNLKGEKAIQTLGEIMEPLSKIGRDKKIQKMRDDKKSNMQIVSYVLKHHYHDVFLIMAALHDEDPKTFEPDILQLPRDLKDLMTDPEVQAIFFSQEQSEEGEPSGSVTANGQAAEA